MMIARTSSRLGTLLAILLCGCLLFGCSSTQEVETSRPRAYEAIEDAAPESVEEARFNVFLERGETDLPKDVQMLRFRVAEVRLHERGANWIRLPSDASLIEWVQGRPSQPKLVLDTRIPPTEYDSLAVTLDHVFVRFGENAGAPLTTAKDAPQKLKLALEPALETPTTVFLQLEPAPSLTRSQDCRWFFVPVFRSEISTEAAQTQ